MNASIMKPKGRDVLAELQANNSIIRRGTAEPAVEPQEPPTPAPTTLDTAKPPPAPPAPEKAPKQTKGKGAEPYPWENASARVPKVFNLRFNEVEYSMLWFLGETALGDSMHSIAMRGAMKEIHRMLKERGIEPPKAR
jgi:hypothetical protein